MEKQHPKLVYEPLGAGEIRLILLEPGEADARPTCMMRHFSLDGGLYYVALSYAWGDPADRGSLCCNGQKLYVTKNLQKALQKFQQMGEKLVLWIDAICIDQSNLEERSSQVQMMRQIYQCSHETFVWLGPASSDSDMAMEFMDELYDLMRSKKWRLDSSDVVLVGSFPYDSPKWLALENLVKRPYFGRAWIVQEISASKSVIMFCGSAFIQWETVELISDELGRHRIHNRATPYLLISLRRTIQKEDRIGILRLLNRTRRCQATDTRDKVYALLGLAEDVQTPDVTPDYHPTVSISDLYKRLTRLLLEKSTSYWNRLMPLSFAGIEFGLQCNLPSWAPHWSDDSVIALGLLGEDTDYNAAGTSAPSIQFITDPDVLVAKGVVIDTIDRLCESLEFSEVDRLEVRHQWQMAAEWEQRCLQFAEKCKPYPTGDDLREVYWRTMVANQDDEHNKAYREFGINLEAWRQYAASYDPMLYKQYQAWDLAMRVSKYHERLCSTQQGYLGLFPKSAQSTDVVCVLLGGSVAYVLRTAGDHFLLVGECYIHGFMNGEALQGDNVKIQDFVLR